MSLSGFAHEPCNSTSTDWYTPPWIFERLNLRFELDPCQPPDGISWIPAEKFYSIHDNGLTQVWNGKVWLNPPYGKYTAKWLARMHEHRNGVALVFSRTDCKWFHDYIAKSDAILFLKSRVKFVDGFNISKGGGAGSGSLLAAWGNENVTALRTMIDLGHFVYNRMPT